MKKSEGWSRLKKRADYTTDRLGKKLDEKIKEVVMSLWLAGFSTTGSCEGHLDWGLKAPWIDIGVDPLDKDLEVLKDKAYTIAEIFEKFPHLRKLKHKNLRLQSKLLNLLTKFYKEREVLEDERLVLTKLGIYGVVRLVNQGVEIQEIKSRVMQKKKLEKYQEEMRDFGVFLKDN